MEFKPKDIVKHVLTGEKLFVLKRGKEQYLVRTSDLREIWMYAEELVALS